MVLKKKNKMTSFARQAGATLGKPQEVASGPDESPVDCAEVKYHVLVHERGHRLEGKIGEIVDVEYEEGGSIGWLNIKLPEGGVETISYEHVSLTRPSGDLEEAIEWRQVALPDSDGKGGVFTQEERR